MAGDTNSNTATTTTTTATSMNEEYELYPPIIHKWDVPPSYQMEYMTDVEGNLDYFCSLVERSKVLTMDTTTSSSSRDVMNLSFQGEDTGLVFGGDVVDKGYGDIRITKSLVQLKRKYPQRVFLLCGNRDCNKIRFLSELVTEQEDTMETADIYWNKDHIPYDAYLKNNQLSTNKISKLKWILECTMGCPTTFETRKIELQQLSSTDDSGNSSSIITDEMVYTSFLNSVDPNSDDPWMLDYLRCGQLMFLMNDCLFVHAGIPNNELCLGKVPGSSTTFETIEEWCTGLNKFYTAQIKEYELYPCYSDSQEKEKDTQKRKRGGESLLDYGVPGGFHNLTMMYANHLDTGGNCVYPSEKIVHYMNRNHIHRLFVGHQPAGDCPWVINYNTNTNNNNNERKTKEKQEQALSFQIFICDTSYSDMKGDKSLNPANNRGNIAITNILITKEATTAYGTLASGNNHGFTLRSNTTTNHNHYSKTTTTTTTAATKSLQTTTTKAEVEEKGLNHKNNDFSNSTIITDVVGKQLMNDYWVKTILFPNTKTTNNSPNDEEKKVLLLGKGEGFKIHINEMEMQEVLSQLKNIA